MTITLDLAPEDEAQLTVIAARQGQNADAAAHALFTAALAQAARFREIILDEDRTLAAEEEIEAIRLGLEDSFAGRVTPLAEWSAKFRARHNILEGTQAMTHEEALRLP